MNTTHNTKTRLLRLATAAVATPALLFAGAGTAQADTGDVSSPFDTGAASSPFDTGAANTPLVPQPHPAAPYQPWVPEEDGGLSDIDWGLPDVSTPSDTGPSLAEVTDVAECFGAIRDATLACAPELVPGGQVSTPLCIANTAIALGECGIADAIGDAASDVWDSIPDSIPVWGPGVTPYRP